MRHRLHIIMAIMSCCFLYFATGCSSDQASDDSRRTDAKTDNDGDKGGDGTIPEGDGNLPLPSDPVPVVPVVTVPDVPPPPPAVIPVVPTGGGHGSQGAVKPARTGNPDDDDEDGPDGVCPNGVQEVLPDNPDCIYDIYGTTTDGPNGPSQLIGFDLEQNGIGYDLGTITEIHRVSAIDFAADGTLYAVGENDNDESVLATINCRTAEATIIGLTEAPGNITDIDFDSFGRLFAYVKVSGANNDEAGIINPISGEYISLGVSGLEDEGNGLGSTPFPADMLYHAGDNAVSIINKLTGVATPGPAIGFIAPADEDPRINAIDNDPFTNIVYVSIADDDNGSSENYLAILNVFSGAISFLAAIPPEAPNGLDGIAVNRRFEECDPQAENPALPEGTACTEDCELIESNCEDQIDNDQDGLIDCEDPDCAGQSCNDENGCTINDICIASNGNFVCGGTPVDCEEIIGNECTMDVCEEISDEPGNDNFKCNSMLRTPGEGETLFGLCTPDENCAGPRNPDGSCPENEIIDFCIVGRCVLEIEEVGPPSFVCEGAAKELVTVEEGGCIDGNSCTADDCEEDEGGICDYDSLEFCDDGNPCTLDDFCEVVVDELVCMPGIPQTGLSCDDDNDCTGPDTCDDGVCVGTPLEVETECDDGNDCTSFDQCDGSGVCEGTDVSDTCLLDADCSNGEPCVGEVMGNCSFTVATTCLVDADCPGVETCENEVAGACACDNDDIACTITTCDEGACNGEPVLDDTLCVTDEDPCTEQECTETGCKTTVMDGPMVCELLLADLSMGLNTLLTNEGLEDLQCNFGLLLCVDGEVDVDCSLNSSSVAACSEATLEAQCDELDNPVNLTALQAAAICAELALVLVP